MWVFEFQTKPNSYDDICWVSVWSYVSLWVHNKREFLRRHLLSNSLNLCKFMSFTQKRIFMEAIVDSQLEVIYVYEFQTKEDSYEDICWASVWSYLSLRVSNQSKFSRRHLLSLSLKLFKFTSFKQKLVFMKTFVESQFEVK